MVHLSQPQAFLLTQVQLLQRQMERGAFQMEQQVEDAWQIGMVKRLARWAKDGSHLAGHAGVGHPGWMQCPAFFFSQIQPPLGILVQGALQTETKDQVHVKQ